MASSFVLLGILLGAFVVCCKTEETPRLVGGWQKKPVDGNQLFTELAHFAVGNQVGDREFFDTVLEVIDAETQVVAGTNYRLTFKIAESTCRVTETYTKELCLPKTQDVKDTCTAVIYDVPWLNQRSVTSFTCGVNAAST
uniref:Putative tick cistatins 1 n=1 Tax=Amblyomma triste TaxID=251400 RepID=A0A023G9N4_AMBTT